MGRTLIVSNRLPITVSREGDGLRVERSAGGLATGLKSTHESGGSVWLGWSGLAGPLGDDERRALDALSMVPVSLSAEEVERYYEGYCNGLLWPLFHGFLGQLPLDVPDWPVYRTVNERFADAVAERWRPGDLVWVHDYQLMLVPGLLRKRLPGARVGFFLHIPFPPSDTFRTVPARESLLEGLLGADLVGFHTAAYLRNFGSSVLKVLGAATNIDRVTWRGRTPLLRVFPMGVDARALETAGHTPEAEQLVRELQVSGDVQLLLGIDRLDYTKGIPRRLLAYERLLEQHPELHQRVRLVQVAVPSRTRVDAYADFRTQVDALVGRINGRFGSPSWAPVHYVYRALPEASVVALYRAADVMLVTPIKDGMNLVAKEFCAARGDDDGVLVLSEFAGAAAELAEALHVNPYDIEHTAAVIHRALVMPPEERRERMAAMRHRVFGYDVHHWARSFLGALASAGERPEARARRPSSEAEVEAAVQAMLAAERLVLLLDYDGTLTPIVATPSLARPDEALRALLRAVAARPGVEVNVVSGRSRDTLEAWLGDLPVGLHAEHGFWSRAPGGEWEGWQTLSDAWRARAREILFEFAERTPGSLVEEKRSGLAWHYRMCDSEFGAQQANELRMHLSSLLTNAPVELLAGDMVVELRPHGSNKGRVVRRLLDGGGAGALAVAFGDDVTDEDMFAALPGGGLSLHVGPQPSRAGLRLDSWEDVRRILGRLAG